MRRLLCGLSVAVAFALPAVAAPNFLVFLADDMRADALHAHGGGPVRTPVLDRLVAEGFSFREAHCFGSNSGAVCIPSRAMLMSGGSWQAIDNSLKGVATLPERLGAAGYETFLAGKWHNGPESCRRSFQSGDAVFLGGMTDQFHPPLCSLLGGELTKPEKTDVFSTDAIAGAAEKFIATRGKDRPFFAWVSFTVPHDPRTRKEAFATHDPAKMPLPANFADRHPFDNGWLTVRDEKLLPVPRTEEAVRKEIAAYYGLIEHMDQRIGAVLDALAKSGVAEDTYVFFLADHGLALGSHGLLGKQNLYEHSMRAPFVVRGPGVPKGGSSPALVYLHDLFATVAELAALDLEKDGPATRDRVHYSRSLAPVWRSGETTVRDVLVTTFTDTMRAIRDPRWKLIRYPKAGVTQLFDLQADPHELKNLAESEPDRVNALRAKLEAHQREAGDRVAWEAK